VPVLNRHVVEHSRVIVKEAAAEGEKDTNAGIGGVGNSQKFLKGANLFGSIRVLSATLLEESLESLEDALGGEDESFPTFADCLKVFVGNVSVELDLLATTRDQTYARQGLGHTDRFGFLLLFRWWRCSLGGPDYGSLVSFRVLQTK
jgi:hypothetical protein